MSGNINPKWISPADFVDQAGAFNVYSGEDIPAGGIVYLSGTTKGFPTVLLAKSDTATKVLSKLYISPNRIPSGGKGWVTARALIEMTTTGMPVGAPVVLSKNGLPILGSGLTTEKLGIQIGRILSVGAPGKVFIDLADMPVNGGATTQFIESSGLADFTPTRVLSQRVVATEITFTAIYPFQLNDVWLIKEALGGGAAQILIKKNSTTVATFALDGTADNAVVRATAYTLGTAAANTFFAVGDILKLTPSGTTPGALVHVLATPRLF